MGSDAAQSDPFDAADEAKLVELINQARSSHGAQPLAVDERLARAARKHTQLMVDHTSLYHQFEGEPDMQTRFSEEGLPSDRQGENIDLDQDVISAHQALMRSPPHRRNILDPEYNVVGVGVIRAGGNIFVTEDFARRLPEYSEPQAEAVVRGAIEQYARSRGLPIPAYTPQPRLRKFACNQAQNDVLDDQQAAQLPGVHQVLAWTAGDPAKLPKAVGKLLSGGGPVAYSLGACFAPSMSHPGGVYWILLVAY